ncbi:MAG: hypothetical protein Q8O37_09015 [Sulfuricellaceae bacterium]|nr:hypothetical protein [Sulfuricellaceae bacterium]
MKNAPDQTAIESARTAQLSPTLPRPATRRAEILEALRGGAHLTHGDALRRGWGWRLAADVFALKEEHGWPIVTTMIDQGEGRNPIARYHLPADSVKRACATCIAFDGNPGHPAEPNFCFDFLCSVDPFGHCENWGKKGGSQ